MSTLSSSPIAAKEARKLLRPLRADLVHLLQELVRMNTVAIPPEGNETPAQLVLRKFLRRYGVSSELESCRPHPRIWPG